MNKNRRDEFSIIEDIAGKNAGIITTSAVEAAGINRVSLKKYVDSGKLIRESKGIYSLSDDFPDEYKILQSRGNKMIYSFGTALYLWGLSDRIPNRLEVTVPTGYNVSRIKKDNPAVIFHYIAADKWELGISECPNYMGNTVRVYDKERCICDLLLNKKQVDKQLYVHAIQKYFSADIDVMRLLAYAKIFRIEEKVRDYMEILKG